MQFADQRLAVAFCITGHVEAFSVDVPLLTAASNGHCKGRPDRLQEEHMLQDVLQRKWHHNFEEPILAPAVMHCKKRLCIFATVTGKVRALGPAGKFLPSPFDETTSKDY